MAPPTYPAGTTINDRYVFQRKLGSDGEVYEAFDRNLDKLVAVKLLDPLKGSPHTWHEAQRLEQLSSRCLIPVLNADVVINSDIRFIVTPLVDGGDLESRAAGTGLSLQEAVRCARHIAAGIDRIHAEGMVHRDIKPANALVSGDDDVMVSDLEMCEFLDSDGRAERNGSFCTVAPETAPDDGYCSVSSDIYSLGATAFYLLSGKYPIDHGLHPAEQRQRIVKGDIRDLRTLAPHVPRSVAIVVGKALKGAPDMRHGSAEEFGNALANAINGKRDWKAMDHPGHLFCAEGERFKGRAAVRICAEPRADGGVNVVARLHPSGRRPSGVSDSVIQASQVPKKLRDLVSELNAD
ncbi:serine/threonine protein kinase [Rhodococcus tibetensis]|uniref:Serine/threonine protein kinase n=1 Tax=Rhodococcus tibetensis TaxID=2965064 RepID=A0ABT1Q8X9_9NOCA|nr:serine/threonine-protein kinase [Rhodococcus sp. FXJ9.536]MCQ4118719.1 serine/threonine protein kinase [Rhodococcus sp. FXJ9.536]